MKKAIWIYSVNVYENGAPFGYTSAAGGRKEKEFQQQLKEALLPEITLEFISYDAASDEVPAADLLLYNQLDGKYLPEEIKQRGLAIPSQDVYTGNLEHVKDAILNTQKS